MGKCDLKCPPLQGDVVFCCRGCDKITKDGCSLSREQMPNGCKEYNCKDYSVYVGYKWDGQQWIERMIHGIRNDFIDEDFVSRLRDVFKEYKERDKAEGRK